MTQDDTAPGGVAAGAPARRRRRALAGLALVLACLVILVTTIAVWTHQVAFNTDRFASLAGTVVGDPAVIDPLSARISSQVVTAIGVQDRIAARLPDAAKPLAGALTLAVRDAIDQRLQVALQDPRIQAALVRTLSFAHAQVMNLLRDRPDSVSVVNGYVTVEVFPVVGAALTELQSIGLIPAQIQLPDLTSPETPDVLSGRLATALGIQLPEGFGTVQLMPADRLLAARSVVQAFDVIVIALLILSIILVALAIWLAHDRRRMLVYLGVGTIIAFLIARLAMSTIERLIIGGIADADLAGAVRAVVDATVADLRGVTVIILVATSIITVAAYLWGRPAWVGSFASAASDATGRATASAKATSSAGLATIDDRAPTRDVMGEAVTEHRSSIERYGLAAIAFSLVWLALGLEIALLGAALVVGFELVLRALTGDEERDLGAASDQAGA